MSGLVSVIVPVYNVEKYLRKCIESIINQTHANLEIILVNDGSQDQCPAICDEYATMDKRIKVIHQANGGLSDARNTGLDICQGDYIYLVDSDDYIECDAIEILYREIIKHDADIAVANINKVYPNGKVVPMNQYNGQVLKDKKQIYKNASSYVTAWGKLYKKEIFSNLRYPKRKLHEDAFIICRVLEQATKIVEVEHHGYNYLQREGSIMNSDFTLKHLDAVEARMVRVQFYISERMYPEALENLVSLLQVLYKGYRMLDMTILENKNKVTMLSSEVKSKYIQLLCKPGKIKYKIAILLFITNKSIFGFCCTKRG